MKAEYINYEEKEQKTNKFQEYNNKKLILWKVRIIVFLFFVLGLVIGQNI